MLKSLFSQLNPKPEHHTERRKDWDKRILYDKKQKMTARLSALDAQISVKSNRPYRGRTCH